MFGKKEAHMALELLINFLADGMDAIPTSIFTLV